MTKRQAIIPGLLAIAVVVGFVAAGGQKYQPRPASLQSYDLQVPDGCLLRLLIATNGQGSATVPASEFIELKDIVYGCGGKLVETK